LMKTGNVRSARFGLILAGALSAACGSTLSGEEMTEDGAAPSDENAEQGVAAAGTDQFGVRMLYPTLSRGKHWVSNWSAARTFTGKDPKDPWFDADHGDASYKVADGVLRISGEVPRMYVHDPALKDQWRDVEITMYFQRVSDDNVAYAGMVAIARSNHGTTGPELRDLCDTRGIGARMRNDGAFDFEKETRHPDSVAVARVEPSKAFPGGLPKNQWLGYKYVVYDRGNDDVRMELYLDKTDGKNGGDWKLVNSFTDTGSNMGIGGKACKSGVQPTLRLTNDPTRDKSESGKPNITVYFRSDGVRDLRYKKGSIREIQAPQGQ
jgi:hypothetical protein